MKQAGEKPTIISAQQNSSLRVGRQALACALIYCIALQPALFYPIFSLAQEVDSADTDGSKCGKKVKPPEEKDPEAPGPDSIDSNSDTDPGPDEGGDAGDGGGDAGGTEGGGDAGGNDVEGGGGGYKDDIPTMYTESVRPSKLLSTTGSGINLGNADKSHTQVDYVSSGAAPLRVARSYHSNPAADTALRASPMGAGWHNYYDRYLNNAGTVYIHRPNGQVLSFTPVGGGAYTANGPAGVLTYTGTVFQYVNNRNETENYSPVHGRMISITKAGLTTTMQFDASYRLAKVVNPFGRSLTYAYDANGRISTITLPDGNSIGYTYGANNNLISTRFGDNSVRQYLYENPSYPNAMTGVIDEAGRRVLTWGYDSAGRPNMNTAGTGTNTVNVTYSGNTATVTDAKNTQRSRTFALVSGRKVLMSLQTAAAATTAATSWSFTYDAKGNPASITTRSGEVRTVVADSRGRETSATRATGTTMALNKVSQWHGTYRLPLQASGLGIQRNWTIDAAGRVTQVTQTGSGITATLMTKTYNAQGLLQTVTDARGATFTFAYDAAGNRTSVTNSLNNTTYYQNFNAHGQATRIQKADGTVITRVFDVRGRMTSETNSGLTTNYAYDTSSKISSIIKPDGSWNGFAYDSAGNLSYMSNQRGENIVLSRDALGNVTNTSMYNSLGTLVKAKTLEYNAVSRLAAQVDARGYRKQFLYAADGRPSGVTDPLGRTKSFQLDVLSRLTSTGNPSTFKTREALGTTTVPEITGYDLTKAAVIKKIDTANVQTNYTLDYFNRKSGETNVDGGNKSAALNAAGDVTSFIDALGRSFTMSRDAAGRLTAITPPGTAGNPMTFSYVAGRNDSLLSSMSDNSGSTSWTYDAAGRALTKQQTIAATILKATITRDALGRVLSLTYPSGMRVDMTYTGDVVSAITVNGVVLLNNISYRPFTQSPVSWKWGNGTAYTRTLDTDGRVTGVSLGTVQRSFGYDAAGRLTSQTDQTPSGPKAYTITYDEANQVSGYTGPGISYGYNYDNNGNRKTWFGTNSGSLNSYTYATGTNRMLTGVGKSYAYNADGTPSTDGLFNFSYDVYGRMTRALMASDTDATYRYNAFGQRVAKTVKKSAGAPLFMANQTPQSANKTAPPTRTPTPSVAPATSAAPAPAAVITWNINDSRQFFYDDVGQMLGEYSSTPPAYAASAPPTQETIWFNGWPVGLVRAGVVYYVNPDHLGTPRSVVQASNNAEVWRWDSGPFGDDLQTTSFAYFLRFPGQYFDQETGLHQNWMRDYDPLTGRYIQADPIGLAGGMSRYGYVGGNPMSNSDFMGLCTCGDIAGTATKHKGSNLWDHVHQPNLKNTCNLAVYDILKDSGSPAPDRNPWMPGEYPLGAGNDGWGDVGIDIPNYPIVYPPQPGDVIAGGGHMGIVVGGGSNGGLQTASQSSLTDKFGINRWGFRAGDPFVVFRRCTCSQ